MVQRIIDFDNYQLSEESIARLNDLDNHPIDYSDLPEQSIEEMHRKHLLAIKMRKKQMFSLRIPITTLQWWKSLGDGYTTIMARLLDEATRNPEWVKKCL